MITLPDFLRGLLSDLRDDFRSPDATMDVLRDATSGFKAWHTGYWKEKRKELIKDTCENCGIGNTDSTMILQHTTHPLSYYQLRAIMQQRFWQAYQSEYDEMLQKVNAITIVDTEIEPRNLCPHCFSVNLRYVNKSSLWVCGFCGKTFDKPNIGINDYMRKKARSEKQKPHRLKCYAQREKAWAKFQSENEKWLVEQMILGTIKYLSFEGVITLCKKCAFKADLAAGKIK